MYTEFDKYSIMFHVSTMLPHNAHDHQQVYFTHSSVSHFLFVRHLNIGNLELSIYGPFSEGCVFFFGEPLVQQYVSAEERNNRD